MLNQYTTRLLRSYQQIYNIRAIENHHLPLVATADLEMRNSRYMLSKKAIIWSLEAYEYCYIFQVDNLSADICKNCLDFIAEDGFNKVKPNSEHMVSYITGIFLCKNYNEQAITILTKYKKRKSFKFSFHGWAELCTVLVKINSNEQLEFFSNKAGKVNIKELKKILCKQ